MFTTACQWPLSSARLIRSAHSQPMPLKPFLICYCHLSLDLLCVSFLQVSTLKFLINISVLPPVLYALWISFFLDLITPIIRYFVSGTTFLAVQCPHPPITYPLLQLTILLSRLFSKGINYLRKFRTIKAALYQVMF
jgi:hypothetical protein